MYFLGFSAFFHDSAVALLKDGRILGFVEEERFNREKHTGVFPAQALRWLLDQHGLDGSDIDDVAFYARPLTLFAARALTALRRFPRSLEVFTTRDPQQLRNVLTLKSQVREGMKPWRKPPRFAFRTLDHHLCHAASAFFVSPFEEAAVMSLDGAGEDVTTWFGAGSGRRLERKQSVRLPHSLGLFYSAVTTYLGFKPWGGEGKVMGLAPYGDPDRFYPQMRELIHWDDRGQFQIDLSYMDYHLTNWKRWVSARFVERFGPPRVAESEMDQRSQDIAAALQRVIEEAALALAHALYRIVPSKNLCLAGGVALNSVMNGRIAKEGPFENIFVQPAANDAGTALGGALAVAHLRHGCDRVSNNELVYLGPEFTTEQCEAAARAAGLRIERPSDLSGTVADALASGAIIGWFQGRMEIGPRALGNRSILADPRGADTRDRLNHRVKHREAFRPFAPSVVAERAEEFFDMHGESPFMLMVCDVRPEQRSRVPAITHVDGTARVQTVRRDQNPRYYDLLDAFGRRTGIPMLVNTSFNVRGEPIVCMPADAVRCFMGTELDVLVLGDLVCRKP